MTRDPEHASRPKRRQLLEGIGRSTPEWIGATPDEVPPARVKLRVFERAGGVCAVTGRKIQVGEAWQCDHRVPLGLGGENRESNLQPVLVHAHREKTKNDVKAAAKARRVRQRHLGIKPKGKRKMPGGKDSEWKQTFGVGWIRRRPE